MPRKIATAAETLGRGRYERRESGCGYRNGYEDGTVKTAEGVLRLQVSQVRGLRDRLAPNCGQPWGVRAMCSRR